MSRTNYQTVARVRPTAAPGDWNGAAQRAPGALRLPGLRWLCTEGGADNLTRPAFAEAD